MQTTVSPVLVKRFRNESEDNVKIDLYSTFQELLKQIKAAMKLGGDYKAFVDEHVPKIVRYIVRAHLHPQHIALTAFHGRFVES